MAPPAALHEARRDGPARPEERRRASTRTTTARRRRRVDATVYDLLPGGRAARRSPTTRSRERVRAADGERGDPLPRRGHPAQRRATATSARSSASASRRSAAGRSATPTRSAPKELLARLETLRATPRRAVRAGAAARRAAATAGRSTSGWAHAPAQPGRSGEPGALPPRRVRRAPTCSPHPSSAMLRTEERGGADPASPLSTRGRPPSG